METKFENLKKKAFLGFDPTYEAWKRVGVRQVKDPSSSFDPTYEAWKRFFLTPFTGVFICFDPTYEAWKHVIIFVVKCDLIGVSILPMRHGNLISIPPFDFSPCRFDPTYEAWKHKKVQGRDCPPGGFDPTYEAWKPEKSAKKLLNEASFDPTYEAWKPRYIFHLSSPYSNVSILPMRHGNCFWSKSVL